MCTPYGKEIGQKKSTHDEISASFRSGKPRKSRSGLTFFDRSFCPFWETTMGARGDKTDSENISHSLIKVVRQGGVFHPLFASRFSTCVSSFQKRSVPWIYTQWPSINGSNFIWKKLTHAEIPMASERHSYLYLCESVRDAVCCTCMHAG